ncbi:hypothetical protein PM082_014990 [Marasmius tenuissimus]|nr:hypothetical protein PM082_014990 [Marasmius tenuissimus]
MDRLLRILLFAICLSLPLDASPTKGPRQTSNEHPVCVVGAGPTGLAAAHALERKNYPVVVFEREPDVGGKCASYYETSNRSIFSAMGALLISNETYTETVPIVEAAGVPFHIAKSVTSGYNYPPLELPTSGQDSVPLTRTPSLTEQQIGLMRQEIVKYVTFWRTEFQPKHSTIRYTNGIPLELSVPMSEWLSSNGYQVLPVVMRQGLALAGYDDLDKTAAVYGLQYFTPDILAYFANTGVVNFVDFYAVMAHYASTLKGQILRDTTVTKVDRSGDAPVVSYVTKGSTGVQTTTCSRLILAIPPLIEALTEPNNISQPTSRSGIAMDLSDAERNVFSKVGMTSYISGAVRMPDVPVNITYSQLPTRDVGQPILATKCFVESSILTTYSWGPFKAYGRSDISLEEARRLLIETYSALDFGPAASGSTGESIRVTIKDEDIRDFKEWDYFPRFQPADIADGIYDRYNALQGYKSTYWASGLNSFELVEFALRSGREIVDTYL